MLQSIYDEKGELEPKGYNDTLFTCKGGKYGMIKYLKLCPKRCYYNGPKKDDTCDPLGKDFAYLFVYILGKLTIGSLSGSR